VAGTVSGVGKTTVASGLMAALRARGLKVAGAKVGPDFIDPGYHALATGRPGRNLDTWMCGPDAVAPLAARASTDADILVVEGVMGLFDGAGDDGSTASTAHVASLLDAPVVLVVDASSMSGSVAALVHGYATFDPRVRVEAVILNRVGSEGHEAMLREALAPLGVPIVGCIHRDDALSWPSRHLGLVPVVEQADQVRRSLGRLAASLARSCDLNALMALAGAAPAVQPPALPTPRAAGRARVAVVSGPAFSFVYPDNLEALERAGAELFPFDPVDDVALPEACTGLYAGGGFPEVFAEALATNRPLLDEVRRRVAGGLVTWAECGGLLWLSRSLDGHTMAGVIDAEATMTDGLTLGYRRARVREDNPVAPAGTELRGHEFHYSLTTPSGESLQLRRRFGSDSRSGFATASLLASYLHVHLGTAPEVAERYVSAASVR